jgi:hypothetical protein
MLAVRREEAHAMDGIHGSQDLGVANHPGQASGADGDEPAQRHRSEHGADAPVPRFCTQNRAIRITQVKGATMGVKAWVATSRPFDRGEHRDGGRDHAVAVEQRRSRRARA